MDSMARKKKPKLGRPPLPDGEQRVRYALRLPPDLLEQFRDACADKPRGEATRVIEKAICAYVAREQRRSR